MKLKIIIKGVLKIRNISLFYQNALLNNELNFMSMKYVDKLIFAHLNINSLRNISEFLVEFVIGKVDILMISEPKSDESFSLNQFEINGFNTLFRLDRSNSRGVLSFLFRKICWQN